MNGMSFAPQRSNTLQTVALAVVVLACTLLPASLSAQTCTGLSTPNLVVNGGFEQGNGFNITGWNVAWNSSADPYMFISNSNVHSGSQTLWMGAIPGSNRIYQSIPNLSPGSVYTVCFWLANDSNCCASSFQAMWNDNPVLDMVNNAGFGYQYYSFQVVAVGKGRDVLSFQARQVPSYYYLDDISLQQCTGCTLNFTEQGKHSGPLANE